MPQHYPSSIPLGIHTLLADYLPTSGPTPQIYLQVQSFHNTCLRGDFESTTRPHLCTGQIIKRRLIIFPVVPLAIPPSPWRKIYHLIRIDDKPWSLAAFTYFGAVCVKSSPGRSNCNVSGGRVESFPCTTCDLSCPHPPCTQLKSYHFRL